MDEKSELIERIRKLEELVADLSEQVRQRDLRIAELEKELGRRGKRYTPKPNTKAKEKKAQDLRRKGHRQHLGSTRPEPAGLEERQDVVCHEVLMDHCPCCGGQVEPTGQFEDALVEDLPEVKPEVHRFRRPIYRCPSCHKRVQGRSDLAVPGSTLGPRVRLLTVYSRAHLGISLGKTAALLEELFDIRLSRAGALGHLRWFARQFDPVVVRLLELLQKSAVVFADETGWRIDGRNVWCWLFANPQIAVFLIDHHRSSDVIERALGTSLPGVLVSDFYAAYNAMDAKKQRCLAHLLRELAKLRDQLPARLVAKNIKPLIDLFQDAILLKKQRGQLTAEEFAHKAAAIRHRLDERWWRRSSDPDCQRIYDRLRRHKEELLLFLDDPAIPADNNAAERDIRSVAATRADGGVNRSEWGAEAFAVAKSIVRTCQKSGLNFFAYCLAALDAIAKGQPAPLPIPDTS